MLNADYYEFRLGHVFLIMQLKPNISLQVNNLRPMKLALGCLFVGVAIGFPVKTTKAMPVKLLSKTCADGEILKVGRLCGSEKKSYLQESTNISTNAIYLLNLVLNYYYYCACLWSVIVNGS